MPSYVVKLPAQIDGKAAPYFNTPQDANCVSMKKYRVTVEGVNFLIEMDSEIRKFGFFTTRFVEAWDQTEAETKVVDMLRVELMRLVRNEKTDTPMIFVEEIQELKTFGEFKVPGTGFTWYPDEREGH